MIYSMKKFIVLTVVLAGFCCADLSSDLFVATPNELYLLDLEKVEVNKTDFYSYDIAGQYAPGERITLNVDTSERLAAQQITKMSVIFFGRQYEILEFSPNKWSFHYQLPQDIKQGDYFCKLYITGTPSINVYQKIDFKIAYPISEIRLEGLERVSENIVRDVLNIKEGEFISDIKLEINRQKVLDLGLFQAAQFETKVAEKKSLVIYTIKENEIVQNIKIDGSIEFSEAELLKNINTPKGEILSNKQLQKDMIAIENFYKEQGYLYSKVVSIERPSEKNKNTLRFKISEVKIRKILLEGNAHTKDYVIRREMELAEGNALNSKTLREDLRRIYNLNYFANVVPDIRLDEETEDVDLVIKVEEKKTSSVNFGGGYSQLDGWFGFIDLFLDNIAGTAQSVLLKGQFGQRFTTHQFKYHNPWMWSRRTSFTAKVWSTSGIDYITGYRERRNGWSAAIGFQRTLHVKETYSFRYEDVNNIDEKDESYLDRAIGYSIAYDTRDNWMNPTSGQYDIFSMDHSLVALGGTINASKYMVQLNRFYPLAPKQVFATRFMHNVAVGDIFKSEQYYVGSSTTVRGHDRVFAKGRVRTIFNFEYRYIFNDVFQGIVFYDIGEALYPLLNEGEAPEDFHTGWGSSQGLGIRLMTPMGPIRLDYAWPEHQEFAYGKTHFSIGHAF